MKNIINNFIPRSIILLIQYIVYSIRDIIDLMLGRRDPLTPPTRLMIDGPRDVFAFKKDGEEFLRYYIEICDLKPNEIILDVGCGIGRKTVPLTKYLDEAGKYEGFDIVKVGIDWCQQSISTRYPNFHFQTVDIFNKYYNPKGKHKPSEFRFPFEDESFDVVVLGSVFTHMVPEDMENYLSEVTRVLRRRGRCLITYFLLNRETVELIDSKKSTLDFKYEMGKYRTTNPNWPENAICFDESYIMSLYEKYGLEIKAPMHYGSWCGRQEFLSYQDFIVAAKK